MPHYFLAWTSPTERLLDIRVRFTAPAETPRLLLPAWRPGRYRMQNYAANVREWSAGERRIWKDGITSWRVDARPGDEVTISYRYYAGVLDAGSSFLDEGEVYVNGSNLFMMVEGLRSEEHQLVVDAPQTWVVETQMTRREGHSFTARDYDDLIDSPFIAAPSLTRLSFQERDARIHLVCVGDEGIETERFLEPMRAIARTQAGFFGGTLPFDEYRFLCHFRDRWHGVEHERSCSIVARRSALLGSSPGDPGFDRMLSVIAHELYHAWNIKRIVPARFVPYDYWQATPTRLLWVVEGVTSYYGELSLARSGIWPATRYLEHLAQAIETLEALPGRLHVPLSQASFDEWLADGSQMHDFGNAAISIYNKGEIVAALLDLTLRRVSGGERSLDDVMRLLWEAYGKSGKGMEEDAFERAVGQIADVGDFFERYVDGVDPLPYDETFSAAGVAFATAARHPDHVSLGARLRTEGGALIADWVIRGGAGMEAGLLPEDELLSLGGTRIRDAAALQEALRGWTAGDAQELLVARAGRTRVLTVVGRPDPRPVVSLRLEGPNDLRADWLRKDE